MLLLDLEKRGAALVTPWMTVMLRLSGGKPGVGVRVAGCTLDRQRRKESAFQVGSSVRKGRGRAGKTFSGESEQAWLVGTEVSLGTP